MSADPASPCQSDPPSDRGSDQAMLAMMTFRVSTRSASLSKLSVSASIEIRFRETAFGTRATAAWRFRYSPTLDVCARRRTWRNRCISSAREQPASRRGSGIATARRIRCQVETCGPSQSHGGEVPAAAVDCPRRMAVTMAPYYEMPRRSMMTMTTANTISPVEITYHTSRATGLFPTQSSVLLTMRCQCYFSVNIRCRASGFSRR